MRIFYASDTTPNPSFQSSLWRNNLYQPLVDLGHELIEFQYDMRKTFQNLDPQYPEQNAFIIKNRPELTRALLRQIKAAHMIYTEIYDVGTLRPFFNLPQGVYGPPGFASEAYNGLGFTGTKYTESGWDLQYDIYGGAIYLQEFIEPVQEFMEISSKAESPYLKDLIGLRITGISPINGLSFGISAYNGYMVYNSFYDLTGTIQNVNGRYTTVGLHTEYLSDPWLIRSEFVNTENNTGDLILRSTYFEVGYKLSEQWQIVARYDWSDLKLNNFIIPISSILEHSDWATGINYWFNQNFVLKLSFHYVEGNRFALPQDFLSAVMNGNLEKQTTLVLFGTQFSF